MFKVTFNYYGRNLTAMREGLRMRGLEPEYKAAFQYINSTYAAFLRERFDKFSKGGGNWKKLAPSTIARRRNKSDTILRDTGLMFSLFQPEIVKTTGLVDSKAKLGMVVDGGGKGRYPLSGINVSKVMGYHQAGGGRLPQRKIIVGPDKPTAEKFAKRIEAAIHRIGKRTGK